MFKGFLKDQIGERVAYLTIEFCLGMAENLHSR
jgi:hypothetical protein